jgi:hypothetical protein
MKSLLESIQEGWLWAIGTPVRVVAVNSFGNVIVQNSNGQFYRIIPENLEYVFLCDSEDALDKIARESAFAFDWDMKLLREQAERALGRLTTNECYHLVIPATLGGAYAISNIKKIPIGEWLSFSGNVAQQIKDLPDGAHVQFKWI